MKKLVLVLSVALGACGGGGSNSGGQGPTPLTGKVNGKPFAPVATRALVLGSGSTPCSIGPISVGFKALVIESANYPNVCPDLWSLPRCNYPADSQSVTVVLATVNSVPPYGELPLAPGSYAATADLGSLALPGSGWAQALDVGADPAIDSTTSSSVSGTIRLDAIPASTAASVTGHLALAFDHGNSLAGDFSAQYCSTVVAVDPCGIASTIAAAFGGSGSGRVCTQ